jgi:hypothetical protein
VPPVEPRPSGVKPRVDLLIGIPNEAVRVADYFEQFPWEGASPDAEVLSAEDFLNALGP